MEACVQPFDYGGLSGTVAMRGRLCYGPARLLPATLETKAFRT